MINVADHHSNALTAGDDVIYGASGDDELSGGAGDDMIIAARALKISTAGTPRICSSSSSARAMTQ
jgi:Ca2+-binding RTX toxin-like protein